MKISIIPAIVSLLLNGPSSPPPPPTPITQDQTVISSVNYSLSDRYTNTFVNNVFSDNILLTLAYMSGKVTSKDSISWDDVRAPGVYTLTILPHQTFAFHDKVLEKYKRTVAVTMNAHFNSLEGFKSDGWLIGDGVCHLASFMNMAAQNAGLEVEAPTNHNFAVIADVPKKYGVAIYYTPDNDVVSANQNLYITNPFDKPVLFIFTHANNSLTIKVEAKV